MIPIIKKPFLFVLFTIAVFLFIYGLKPGFLPLNSSKLVVIIFLLINILLPPLRNSNTSTSNLLKYILLYLSFIWISLLSDFINQTYEYKLTYILFLSIVEYLLGAFLIGVTVTRYFDRHQYLFIISTAIFLQAIFILVSFNSIEFRAFVDSILKESGNTIHGLTNRRVRGFSHSASSGLSLIQSCGVMVSIYLIASVYKVRNVIILSVYIVAIFLSTIFVGRLGLIISSMYLLAFITINAISRNKIKSIVSMISIGVVSAFVISILLEIIYTDNISYFIDVISKWSFEIYYSYMESEELYAQSSSTLFKSMLFIPTDIKTMIIGGGKYYDSDTINAIKSDSGYIRLLFSIGLSAVIYYYMWFIGATKIILKHSSTTRLYYFLFLVAIFISEIKEPFLLKPGTARTFFLILFSLEFGKPGTYQTGKQVN